MNTNNKFITTYECGLPPPGPNKEAGQITVVYLPIVKSLGQKNLILGTRLLDVIWTMVVCL